MDYRWFGAIHLIAAVVWVSGLLLLAITTSFFSEKAQGDAIDNPFVISVLRWNRRVTTPAMLVLWGCGIVLISKAGLFHGWILIKLLVLLLLSACHGTLSRSVRHLLRNEAVKRGFIVHYGASVIILAAAVIIFLAKFKPTLF